MWGTRRPTKLPSGTGPVWVVSYRVISNSNFDILAVQPNGTEVKREPGLRHILIRGQDELDAMRRAKYELDWLKP